MLARDEVKAIKIDALCAQGKKLIGAAGNAARQGGFDEAQVKILQVFILLDLCWKLTAGEGGEHDIQSALLGITQLSDRFQERIKALLAVDEIIGKSVNGKPHLGQTDTRN